MYIYIYIHVFLWIMELCSAAVRKAQKGRRGRFTATGEAQLVKRSDICPGWPCRQGQQEKNMLRVNDLININVQYVYVHIQFCCNI